MELTPIALVLALCVIASNAVPLSNKVDAKKAFDFDEIYPDGKPYQFGLRGFNGSWISDTEFIYTNTIGNIMKYNVFSAEYSLFLNGSELQPWARRTYVLSPNKSKMLIRYDVTAIFRHSIVARYAIYDLESKTVLDIAGKELLNLCVWSPNGQDVAFVKQNNVYVVRNSVETQLTFDGIDGIIYNGVPDWVYEEEVLSSGGALWFSPNGDKLAIASFNDTNVEEFTYNLYGAPGSLDSQYEKEIRLRYPKAGRENPTIQLRVVDLSVNPVNWQTIQPPVSKISEDYILNSVNWITNTDLGAVWMNRRQNISSYQACNVDTSVCNEKMAFEEPNGWCMNSSPVCTRNGRSCHFMGYFTGSNWYNMLELDIASSGFFPVAPNDNTVLAIYGVNERTFDKFYLATGVNNPHHRYVYKNNECLSCSVVGPEGVPCTFASASFSPDFSYYMLTCSGPTPAYVKLFRTADNTEILNWEDNKVVRERLESYHVPKVLHLKVPVEGGFEAAVKLYLPAGLDVNAAEQTKKYAMIVDVYGGPNSVRVLDSFSLGFKAYLVSSRNVIYCEIDGRGSGNKGKAMLFSVNNKLGTVEIEDQIAVAKYLQDKYSFIDSERSGIWGWSYGGFATATALSKDKDRVFQCGISVAPVTSWIYYDSIYTERYMGLPTAEDNLVNYNASDITRHINNIQTHDFLLIHGNADDNVHFQQAMVLSRALQNMGVMFEQMSYPDEAHGLNGVTRHLYHTMEQFWVNCLNLDVDE